MAEIPRAIDTPMSISRAGASTRSLVRPKTWLLIMAGLCLVLPILGLTIVRPLASFSTWPLVGRSNLSETTSPAANQESNADNVRAKRSFKRRQNQSANELTQQLLRVGEVALGSDASSEVLANARARKHSPDAATPGWITGTKFDGFGLPVRMGSECLLEPRAAKSLDFFAPILRACMQGAPRVGRLATVPGDANSLRDALVGDDLHRWTWLCSDAVPTLVQILQGEDTPTRLLLVDLLDQIPGQKASTALAQRTIFDLEPEVRQAAFWALTKRPASEFREVLLSGLRYPWAPVAVHAAETLVALEDTDAVPALVKMLDAPPVAQHNPEYNPIVREVVRIRHHDNCLLCHPPSFSTSDLVRGTVPQSAGQYYQSPGTIIVRADATYLRQDFSVMLPEGPNASSLVRFDFLVRTGHGSATTRREAVVEGELGVAQAYAIQCALQELQQIAEGTALE